MQQSQNKLNCSTQVQEKNKKDKKNIKWTACTQGS